MDQCAHAENPGGYDDAGDFDEHADAHGFERFDRGVQRCGSVSSAVVLGCKEAEDEADEEPEEGDDEEADDGGDRSDEDWPVGDAFTSHGAPGQHQ